MTLPSSIAASAPVRNPGGIAHALALMDADLKAVDALILNRVSAEIPLIRDVASHIIASGGKRLRPLLTLLSSRLCGYRGERHIGLAAAVEFIHTATLLHDDVVDESKLRRGLATANEVWGNKASVLVGDFLLSQAFRLMVADQSLRVLDILSAAAAIISKGEVLQLMTEGELATGVEQHLEVISAKTAALFAAACELGAVVSDKPHYEQPLRAYGQAVGVAFQLVDDALDYAADAKTLGKTVGDDFREGKLTLPVIFAYAEADAQEKTFWQRVIAEHEQREGDLQRAIMLMQKHRALEQTFTLAREYCSQARLALQPFAESEEKSAMAEIIDFCVERMY